MASRFGTTLFAFALFASFAARADSSTTVKTGTTETGILTSTYTQTTMDGGSALMNSSAYGISSSFAAPVVAQPSMWQNMLPAMLPAVMGMFGGDDKKKAGNTANDEKYQSALGGTGTLGSCEDLPEHVRTALSEAMYFRDSCNASALDKNKNIAINDYSSSSDGQTAYMYIFDKNGTCLKRTEVGYGNANPTGEGNRNAPVPCAEAESHATPPGFHVTEQKGMGGDYPGDVALTLVGLQGQGSRDRGILIHPAVKGTPGLGATFGCSSVCKNESLATARNDSACMQEVLKLLAPGSLVYNYFGSKLDPGSCKCSAETNGLAKDGTMCQTDRPGKGCESQEGRTPASVQSGGAAPSSSGTATSGKKKRVQE